MSDFYVLADKTPVRAINLAAWAEWFEDADRMVAHTMVRDMSISTVFLGIDHNFYNSGPPILFETMVSEDGQGGDMDRYSTWEEALAGHEAMVTKVRLQQQAESNS